MKTKVNEAVGPALDWMVATAQALQIVQIKNGFLYIPKYPTIGGQRFMPTTDWSQGGPIINMLIEDGAEVWQGNLDLKDNPVVCFLDIIDDKKYIGQGPDLLIAAMRCFVMFKLGDEVDVPDALI